MLPCNGWKNYFSYFMTNTPIQNDPGRALSQREIARAAGIVMLAYVMSGILGLVRQMILSSTFGGDRELDAFYAALRLPETLFALIAGGALGSAFIPVFSGFLNRDDFDGAWRLASVVMTTVALVATVAALLGFVFAQPLVTYLLLPSASADMRDLTTELMQVMLLTVVIFGVSGLVMGILNAHQHFAAPALTPSMYNIGLIFGALVFAPSMGIHGLAWGAVLGALLHLAVQIPALVRLPNRKLIPSLALRAEGVYDVLRLMGPRLLGLAVVQVNFWVNIALASAMVYGSITALQTAYTLMFVVLGILGQALGTAIFPTLSAQHASNDYEGFQRTLSGALRNVLFLSIPAGLGMAALSLPIVTVLFERGEWTASNSREAAWALVFYGVGLMGHAALEILARTYYALHDTWTPVLIGSAAMLLNVILSFVLVVVFRAIAINAFHDWPFGGLALANSLATALESTVLWFILRRRIPDLNTAPIIRTLTRTLVAALGMVVVVVGIQVALESWSMFIQLGLGITLGAASFWGLAMLLRVEIAQSLPRQLLARLKS